MSPESTTLYYEHITRTYTARFGDYGYPEILIYSVNFQKFVDWQHNGQWNEAAREMAEALERLHVAGADFGLIATNTMHIVFEEVQRAVHMPLLSIIASHGGSHPRSRTSVRRLAGDRVHHDGAILPRWPRAVGNHGARSRARRSTTGKRCDLSGIVPGRDPAQLTASVSGNHRTPAPAGARRELSSDARRYRCWSNRNTVTCPCSTPLCCTPERHWISLCNRHGENQGLHSDAYQGTKKLRDPQQWNFPG